MRLPPAPRNCGLPRAGQRVVIQHVIKRRLRDRVTAQLRSQRGFPCTCVEHPGRTSASFPENPFSASFSSTFRDVLRVVPDTVNREYSGGFANAHLALSGQLVVDISGKRVDVRDILLVSFLPHLYIHGRGRNVTLIFREYHKPEQAPPSAGISRSSRTPSQSKPARRPAPCGSPRCAQRIPHRR